MGVASMVAHSGGVVLNLYLLALRLPTTTILATNNALVVFTNAVKLVGYRRVGFLTGAIMLAAVLSIPALAAGAWLGSHPAPRVRAHLDRHRDRRRRPPPAAVAGR